MKSKSFDLKKGPSERGKHNKTFDFVGLYKSAAETNAKLLENPKTVQNFEKENNFSNSREGRSDQSHMKKKKGRNELIDISHITIDGHNLSSTGRSSPVQERHATSTPNVSRKAGGLEPKVKSIMKTSQQLADDAIDSSVADTPAAKPKKRNKSVSFMLDDTDEIAVKKTKSNDSMQPKKTGNENPSKQDKKKQKKIQKSVFQREDKTVTNGEVNLTKKMRTKVFKKTVSDPTDSTSDQTPVVEKKKKFKKLKKQMTTEENSDPMENDSNNNEESETKPKKIKKKKHNKTVSTETSEEAPAKKVKKEVKPDVIAEDLENLSIGDNAHTLTNLLDEMTVVDKDKKKRNKLRRKKNKEQTPASVSSSETQDLEKIEEGKEKVKWKKRKWNKDMKGDIDGGLMSNTILIDNLPLKIMCSYKKLLLEHFDSCGLIKRVGLAEVYPTEDPKPVFTTTIVFCSEAAATKALEEDNTLFQGNRIRVKRPLPPTQTTIVVRSYAELTDQNVSSVFISAGRIRSIRQLVKGKKAMATAFIEFDGPETVERAIKMAEDAKIGGKKIYVSKFEMRKSKHKVRKTQQPDSENEGDSEDSND